MDMLDLDMLDQWRIRRAEMAAALFGRMRDMREPETVERLVAALEKHAHEPFDFDELIARIEHLECWMDLHE